MWLSEGNVVVVVDDEVVVVVDGTKGVVFKSVTRLCGN